MRKHKMKDRIIKRNAKGKKISKRQETINRKNSKHRVRVEHIFGFCEQSLHGIFSRLLELARNAAYNTLTNLAYNMNVFGKPNADKLACLLRRENEGVKKPTATRRW